MQYKSKQPITDFDGQEIQLLEASEPGLVEEMLKKKKWYHEQKDPARI